MLSEYDSSYSFMPAGIWSRVLEDARGSCCGLFVNLFGLEGRVVRELHHLYSFSKCVFLFFFYSSEKSSCISRTKKEFGTGQGKMQYAPKDFREIRSSLSCSLGIPHDAEGNPLHSECAVIDVLGGMFLFVVLVTPQ